MNTPGYEQLAAVLQAAFDQAANGKGAERHANDLPFHEQRMQGISGLLNTDGGMAYQVCKKILEARDMPHAARERELLGAIVYTAGMIIYHRERHIEPGIDPVFQATRESVIRDQVVVVGFDTASGVDKDCTVLAHRDEKGALVIDDVRFDEARADVIGQNGNDGEHYRELELADERRHTSFKDLANQMETPAPQTAAPAKAPVALPNTDALVDPTGRPQWHHLPNWIKWIAQDPRGVWKGFEKKPEPVAGRWRTDKRWSELNSGEPLIGENWVNTLEARP